MTILQQAHPSDRNHGREDSLEDTISGEGVSGSSAMQSMPLRRSASEMSDGWIDAGTASDATAAVTTNPPPSHGVASLSLMHDNNGPQTTPVDPASRTIVPLKPQHPNNPFLRRKSSAAGDSQALATDKDHAAAWAELMPGAQSHAGSDTNTILGNHSASNISESAPPPAIQAPPAAAISKDKGPALDHLGMPNRQESGILDGTTNGATISQSGPLEEEYPPPPGPPPRKSKNETYQIKHVRWLDHNIDGDTRATPILMQNLNGPCPLLALVNALTMSTPRHSESSLVEALRSREQVSLGLLLDAVVEELISNRMSAQAELPDMVELYDFLLALHTGMNVNPAFIPATEAPNLIDFEPESPSLTQPHRIPGGFEATKEMRLYSTFTIPLIHGWLPPRSHPVHAALERSARTHEDAENLLTREEELEDKLAKEGLSEEEQQLLEDIGTIKYFLTSSATQLTGYGLDIIAESMPVGGFAILFRNNHFSTLHKHPVSGNVFSLVTDMGYAKYPEIVWESLVDTNGLGAELFSGDFRTVSHGSIAPVTGTDEFSSDRHEEEWSTVQDSGKGKQAVRNVVATNEGSSSAQAEAASREQEDADLALALQLQEEEEERHRRENPPPRASTQQTTPQGQRRHTTRESGNGLSVHSTPPRRGLRTSDPRHYTQNSPSTATTNSLRPPRGAQPNNSPWSTSLPSQRPRGTNTRPGNQDGAPDVPPPTYESALEDRPYNPPTDSQHHPTSPIPSPAAPQSNSEGTPVNFDALMARAEADRTTPRSPNFDNVSAQRGRHQATAVDFDELVNRAEASIGAGSAYHEAARRRRGSSNIGPGIPPKDRERDCCLM